MNDPPWRCRDGRLVRPGEMSDRHLLNAIALIQRSNGWRWQWLPRLLLEVEARRLGLSTLRKGAAR